MRIGRRQFFLLYRREVRSTDSLNVDTRHTVRMVVLGWSMCRAIDLDFGWKMGKCRSQPAMDMIESHEEWPSRFSRPSCS